jgi:glutamate-ammonia-ligase adenylyltransferase
MPAPPELARTGPLAAEISERLRQLLAALPDPLSASRHLQRFREEQPAAFARIIVSPACLQMLLTVFSHSEFLSGELMQTPEWIEELPAHGDLHRVRSVEEYIEDLSSNLPPNAEAASLAPRLALYRRRQLLRILLRDILGFGTLGEITEEISNLADSTIECALGHIRRALVERHGEPGNASFAVISLGKLGGRELNYSSDIDLMFVYSANGESNGLTYK